MTETIAWVKWRFDKWRNDEGLRMCSLAARGLWADLLAIMHGCVPYGHLLVNGRVPTPRQIASLVGMTTEKEVAECLNELRDNGVCSVTDNGALYCRRMVRDNAAREQSKEYGSRGGNPSLTKRVEGRVNPTVEHTVNIEKERERERESDNPLDPPKRRSRVPDDWWPDANGIAFAHDHAVDPAVEVPRFRDHHLAKGSLMASWAAAWRTWVQNAVKFRGDAKPNGANGHDLLAGADKRIEQDHRGFLVNGYYLDNVSVRLAEATGITIASNDRIMVQWLADGYEPDEFVPIVRRVVDHAPVTPKSLAYFDKAVREERPTSRPLAREAA